MSDERRKQIKEMLYNDGINTTLIDSMTDRELEQAAEYEDYSEYDSFMNWLARKYNI